jgi:hypothetical protein
LLKPAKRFSTFYRRGCFLHDTVRHLDFRPFDEDHVTGFLLLARFTPGQQLLISPYLKLSNFGVLALLNYSNASINLPGRKTQQSEHPVERGVNSFADSGILLPGQKFGRLV